MTQFDWQTDEDDWDTNETAVSSATPVKRKWRRFVFVALGFVGITIFGIGLLFSQIQKRAKAATVTLSDGLLATHTLMQESAVTGDLELFNLALFPAEKWRETQTELLARQLFWNRSSLGLWLDLESFDPQDTSQVEVTYSPDLQSAEVTAVLPYVTMGNDGQLEAVQLQKTAVYRQVDGGWQYAPFPLTDFWGEEVEADGRNLTIKAPQRDEEISKRLVHDIDELIVEACSFPEIACPEELQVHLRFLIDPDSSYELNQNYRVSTVYQANSGRVLQIKMPSPTLVGLPIDEDGYDASLAGYASQVIVSIMFSIDSNCCYFGFDASNPFVLQLQSMGLNSPYPVSYHPQSALIAPPIPLPDQDIMALCQDGLATTNVFEVTDHISMLYHYDPTTNLWSEAYSRDDGFISQMISGNGHGVFLTTNSAEEDSESRLEWHVNGETVLIDVTSDWMNLSSVFQYWDEESDDLLLLYNKVDDDLWEERLIKIDPDSCVNGSACSFESLSNYPIFSPERTHSMVRMIDGIRSQGSVEFWLGNELGEPLERFGTMFSPTWRNEQTLLFTKVTNQFPMQISLMKVRREAGHYLADEAETLLTSEMVNEFLDAKQNGEEYMISGIVLESEKADDIVPIFAIKTSGDGWFRSGYLFNFDTVSRQLDWMEPFENVQLMLNITFSPDGRFLQVIELKDGKQTLHFLDMETGELQSYAISNVGYIQNGDWSQDGNWFVIAEGESLQLIAPAHEYERKVFYPSLPCNTAVWVNKDSSGGE